LFELSSTVKASRWSLETKSVESHCQFFYKGVEQVSRSFGKMPYNLIIHGAVFGTFSRMLALGLQRKPMFSGTMRSSCTEFSVVKSDGALELGLSGAWISAWTGVGYYLHLSELEFHTKYEQRLEQMKLRKLQRDEWSKARAAGQP
jgi:hypothetical protein